MHTTGARPEHVVYGPDYKQRGREKNRSSYHRLKAQKGTPEVLPVLPALCRIGTTTHSPERCNVSSPGTPEVLPVLPDLQHPGRETNFLAGRSILLQTRGISEAPIFMGITL